MTLTDPKRTFMLAIALLAAGCQRSDNRPQTAAAPASALAPNEAASPTPSTPADGDSTPPGTSPPAPENRAAAADASGSVSVDIRSWKQVEAMIAEHRGRVVVVDVWSTWCVPCLREFPHLVALHEAYPERVACISVNIDYAGVPDEPPESFQAKVLAFLRARRAAFQNVICSDPDEQVLRELQISSIPAVLVYDRQGVLKKTFVNDDQQYGDDGFSYPEHIEPVVEKELE